MESDETKRIRELLREREQGDGNMDWMYKKSKPDTEDYLLGKKIDKYLEEEEEPPENKNDPGAIFTERVKANIAMDMAAKMREDPLFQIKRREEDAKKTLLQNPVRMKQLQKLVKKREKSRSKKKKKKEKKKKRSHSSGSDSDEDDIIKKYLAVLSKKHQPESEASGGDNKRDRDKEHNSDPEKTQQKSNRKYRERKSSESEEDDGKRRKDNGQRKLHPPSAEYRRAAKPYGLLLRGEQAKNENAQSSRKPSRSPERSMLPKHRPRSPAHRSRSPAHRSRSPAHRSRSPKIKKSARERSPKGKPLPDNRKSSSRRSRSPKYRSRSPKRNKSRSPKRLRSRSPAQNWSHKHKSRSPVSDRSKRRSRSRSPAQNSKRKLTAEEKRRKLEEMQENATWRDEQREKNVERYRKETEEEEMSHRSKGSSSDFITPLMASHVSQSSVQDRIKRNMYNVQRTKADLDKDFTRR